MKNKRTMLDIAARIARGADRLLNGIIAVMIAAALLYGGFGLWDTWQIYKGAEVDSELLKYKPVLDPEGDGSNPTLSELMEVNPDVCAWLTIDGTNIDYPVVQGDTNMDYINRDVYGEFSLSGSVFLDSTNGRDFLDHYSLIYAHHMEGNVMFGELPDFMEQAYFYGRTGGTLFLPDRTCRIEIFACLYTDAYDPAVFNPAGGNGEAAQAELLEYLKRESVQYREIGVTAADRILGLSTCSEASTNGRVLLFGRLRDYGED